MGTFRTSTDRMPPKRTPVKNAKDAATPKSKKGDKSKSRVIVPEVRSRDSSADSSHSVPAGLPVIPMPAGISPEFFAYMQMQERLRLDERKEAEKIRADEKAEAAQLRAILENQRKNDLERAEVERFAMNKAHETQLKLLQHQLSNMSSKG